MNPDQPLNTRSQRLITVIIIIMLLLAILLVILDWTDVLRVANKADWRFTLAALGFTAVSYMCLSLSYALVNRYFGIRVRLWELYNIGFTSSTLNNILAFMGAAGHSLRLVLIGRRGKPGEILAASIFHSYLNNVTMLTLLPISLIWLVGSHNFSGAGALTLGLVSALLIVLILVATFLLFFSPLRFLVLQIVQKIWHFVTHRDISPLLEELDNALKQGIADVRGRKLILVVLLLGADWGFAAAALFFCFMALGITMGWGVLLSGFGFGISAGNLSLIPGGLGIQEASMAGIYALLGISFTQAVLAAILFRVVYDFIPFFLSLIFYRGLLRKRGQLQK